MLPSLQVGGFCMKRILIKKLVVLLCVGISLMSLSCGSTAGTVWDDSVPPEQRAKIYFAYFEPTSYNQMPVNKKTGLVVSFPAGNAAFQGDVNWFVPGWVEDEMGTHRFRAKDVGFSCKLEGGKEYYIIVTNKEEKNRLIWGIELYNDVIKNRVGLPPKEKLIGFIPFNPPVISPLFGK